MEPDADPRWLGEDMVQQAHPRITIPPEVVDREIVEPGASVFWAVHDDGVHLSKDRGLFEGNHRARVIGVSSVSDDRVVSFPEEIAQRDGFGPGDVLHFLTAREFSGDEVCQVVPEALAEQ